MRRRDLVSVGFGGAALVASVLAIGGAIRWTQALVAILVAVAVAPIIKSRRVSARISPLLALIALALALTALQLLPLPHAITSWLDPDLVALRDDGAALAGTSPLSTITLDAPATTSALAYFLILLGIAVVAMRLAATESGRYRVLAAVAGLCGFTALLAGVHYVLDARSLYGLYRPREAGPHLLAPLLSNNHLGCLMAIGTTLALGLAMYRRQPPWLRVLWIVVMAGCGLTMLETYSRGAALAVGLGAFVTIGVLVAQRLVANETPRRRRASFVTNTLPIMVVAACTVTVVLYAGAGGVAEQWSKTSLDELHAPRSKFAAWRSGIELVDESPWVGIGRGALEPVFTRVHPASAFMTFSNLENEYLQAVVDWGVPGALLLGLAALWLVVTALRRWRDGPLAAGALGALAVVMLQSNVDFGVELLGIAVPITAVAATLAYVPVREASPKMLRVLRALRGAHVAALAGVAALLLSNATRTLDEDHQALAEGDAVTLAQLRAPIERHPLDYFGYAVAADVMQRAHDPSAARLLNHALLLHPTAPSLHVMAAHMLLATGHPDQAAIEYAAALPAIRDKRKVIAEVASRLPPALAPAALPTDPEMLDGVLALLGELKRVDLAIAWLGRVLELQPRALHACELLYALGAKNGEIGIVPVVEQHCHDYQPAHDVRLQLARVLLERHAEPEILHLLGDVDTWQGRSDEKTEAWLVLCDAQLALAYWDEAKRCLRRLDASGLIGPERAKDIADRLERIQQAVATPK